MTPGAATMRPLSPGARTTVALVAATAINLPLGTIYAFSVFLKPMESLLSITRAETTLVFGIATVCLTIGMNMAPRLYRFIAPVPLLVACALLGGSGLFIAARASGLFELLLGYGLIFGLGGGCAFTVLQQGVNQSLTRPSGMINGYVISLFPLGAMIGAPLIGWTIASHGLRVALAGLGVTVLLTGLLAAALVRFADIRMADASSSHAPLKASRDPMFIRLFLVFFLAASAGLVVLSQAAGILQAYGGQTVLALAGTTIITGTIAAARIGGGWLVDRFAIPHVIASAHLLSLAGALILVLLPGAIIAVPTLTMIGVGYGLISGAALGTIARFWHKNAFGAMAGRLYIGWCFAAVCLPVLAGWLFDRTQGYGAAMLIAAAGNAIGALLGLTMPRTPPAGLHTVKNASEKAAVR